MLTTTLRMRKAPVLNFDVAPLGGSSCSFRLLQRLAAQPAEKQVGLNIVFELYFAISLLYYGTAPCNEFDKCKRSYI